MAVSAALGVTMAEELDVGALYREHGEFIARVIERLTGPGPHVDDLLQESFVAAFKSRNRYDESRASATTWLYSIAANISKRYQRGRWRLGRLREKLMETDLPVDPDRPDDELEREENIALVHDVLKELPFKQREVFALYELEGIDGQSIAEIADIPEGTVWTRLHHARKTFTKLMRHKMAKEGLS